MSAMKFHCPDLGLAGLSVEQAIQLREDIDQWLEHVRVERQSGAWGHVWRHRLAGHQIDRRSGIFSPEVHLLCRTCGVAWRRELL